MISKGNQKYKVIIMVIMTVIVLCILGYFVYTKIINKEQGETGSFNKMIYFSNNYQVSINSTESGHPSGETSFNANAWIENYKYNGKKYSVDFSVNYYGIVEHNASIDYPNIQSYPEIRINGKLFKYEIHDYDILLIYQPENLDCYVTIIVQVSATFDVDSGDVADNVKISVDDLSNKNISGIINFELLKKSDEFK